MESAKANIRHDKSWHVSAIVTENRRLTATPPPQTGVSRTRHESQSSLHHCRRTLGPCGGCLCRTTPQPVIATLLPNQIDCVIPFLLV